RAQFFYERSIAPAPGMLGDATAAWLRGSATTLATQIDSSMIAGAENCIALTEPALFSYASTSYLATSCIVNPGDPSSERLVLLREAGTSLVLVGDLLGAVDAIDLGGTRVEQIDLALAKDDSVLAIVTPIDDSASVPHRGCVVLEVANLSAAT